MQAEDNRKFRSSAFSYSMKLAESSRRKLENFFREYLNDVNFRLPNVKIYTGKFSGYFTSKIKVAGITFGRRIFIFPELLSFNRQNQLKLSEELVAHEIAHVLQYRREGFFGFLFKYLRDYRANLRNIGKRDFDSRRKAYLEIPFEIEAREVARKFIEWNDKLR